MYINYKILIQIHTFTQLSNNTPITPNTPNSIINITITSHDNKNKIITNTKNNNIINVERILNIKVNQLNKALSNADDDSIASSNSDGMNKDIYVV